MGTYRYLKNKDLHLYLVVINYEPELKCNSTFTHKKSGEQVPEMIDFKWVGFDEYKKYFSIKLSAVFDEVIPLIKLQLDK